MVTVTWRLEIQTLCEVRYISTNSLRDPNNLGDQHYNNRQARQILRVAAPTRPPLVSRSSFAHPILAFGGDYALHALLYFVIPSNLGNQYHNKLAAGLPCTEADLSCRAAGG